MQMPTPVRLTLEQIYILSAALYASYPVGDCVFIPVSADGVSP